MNNNKHSYSFFLDETGDHGLSFVDPNFPLFLLAGILFENTELKGTYYVESQRLKNKINDFASFFKRDNIIGLQVADLCAYSLAHHILNTKEPYIPFQIIEKKIYHDGNGKYEGYGLKVFS